MPTPPNIVIIGAGQSGLTACAKLRAHGHTGSITVIGREPVAPYQRPPLSKTYPSGEYDRSRLFLKPSIFYATTGINLRVNQEAASIDPEGKTVTLASGETLPYDLLGLTTGAQSRRLPESAGGDLPGVLYLRTLADSDSIAAYFANSLSLLVIGGGYIGLEIAATARKIGLKVTVAEAEARLLARVAGEQTAARIASLHEANGVALQYGSRLERLEAVDHGITAHFADGSTSEIDFVIVGIGAVPITGLASTAGLATDNGIAVDAHCRTSNPHIFAAGDCASFPFKGQRLRLESVQNAIDHGEAMALSMLGEDTPYEPVPWFWSNQYDMRLQITGLSQGATREVLREGDSGGPASIWYYRDDTLLAVDALNEPRAFMVAKRLLLSGTSPDPAQISDPGFDLKKLI